NTIKIMETTSLDFSKIFVRLLELIIVKPIILPLKIYKNALSNLSSAHTPDSEENVLSSDFPLYTWFVGIFDAIIVVIYPIGVLIAIVMGTNSITGSLITFLGALALTYVAPLIYGLIREMLQI